MTVISEGASLSTNTTDPLNTVMGWQTSQTTTDLNTMEIIGNKPGFFEGIGQIIKMDQSFWTGDWSIYRLIIWSPIFVTVIVGLILTFFLVFTKNL